MTKSQKKLRNPIVSDWSRGMRQESRGLAYETMTVENIAETKQVQTANRKRTRPHAACMVTMLSLQLSEIIPIFE